MEGDFNDLSSLEEAIEQSDAVIHAGALVSFDPRDRKLLYQINSEGTENLVNVCLKYPRIQKLVHISSVSTFSPSKPQPTIINEQQGFNPDHNTSDYARSKYRAELEVIRGVEEGLKAAIINPSIVLAPGQANESSAGLIDYVKKGRPFYTDGWLNYVDARDVARLSVDLLENGPENGQRIIASAGHIPYQLFFQKLAGELGVSPPRWKAGFFLSTLAWRLDAIKSLLTGSKRFITRFTAGSASRKIQYSSLALPQYFPDFQFRSLDDSIQWVTKPII